jgi:hypothetical protein
MDVHMDVHIDFLHMFTSCSTAQLARGLTAPAHPAADLAYVNGRVDRVAHVHDNVGPQQVPVTGESVQLHLADGGPKHKIVEGASTAKSYSRCSSSSSTDWRVNQQRILTAEMNDPATAVRWSWHQPIPKAVQWSIKQYG